MPDSQLLTSPALELAALVRSGEVSASELTELALTEIEEQNPTLGAFIMTDAERALEAAAKIEPGDQRPFAGVPTAIKDIGAMLEGYPFTCGAKLFGEFVAPIDSAVTRRIKNAGFVITGKTNLPEFGILPVTESSRYGPARNPYDTSRTPGGSSGGAAAAVASGMLPVAHGSDGAGSLRIPAACCGLVGFKASRNRISSAPLLAESEMATEGFLTRTVADAAATLDVLAGYEVGDANWAPPPRHGTFLDAAHREPGRLRIGFTIRPTVDRPVDQTHVDAVVETAEVLESLGHEVVEADVPWTNEEMLPLFMQKWSVGVAMLASFAARVSGQEVSPEIVERLTWEFYEQGIDQKAVNIALVDGMLKSYIRGVIAVTSEFDAILTPVLNQRPVPIGSIDSSEGMPAFEKAIDFTSFTAGINLAGLPATALPTGIAEDGLPVAIQLIGRPADEETLFSLAAQLENVHPWIDLRP
ncbi:MAG: amidase [Solirubrobacterales bacterium]